MLSPFLGLAEIDEECASFHLSSNLFRCKALDAGARIGDQFGNCFRLLDLARGFFPLVKIGFKII